MLSASDRGLEAVLSRIAVARDAGIELVQVRERRLPAAQLLELVRASVRIARGSQTKIIVNDRLDVALAADASGVHLREDSFAALHARSMTPPGFLIGRSVHSAVEAAAASAGGGLDYLIFGAVFPSSSKPADYPVSGTRELERAVAAASVPVLAVGGVERPNIEIVKRTGAAGFAAIRYFATPDADAAEFARREWSFDTP